MLAGQLDVGRGDALRQLHRWAEPQQLLDRRGDEARVVAQSLELTRVAEEVQGPAGDEVHRRLVTGAEQQGRRVEQLVVGEPVAVVLGDDERAEQVVAW